MSILKITLGALALGGLTVGQVTTLTSRSSIGSADVAPSDTPYPLPSFSGGADFSVAVSATAETTLYPLPDITGPDFTVGPVDPPVPTNDKREARFTLVHNPHYSPSHDADGKREARFTRPHNPHGPSYPSETSTSAAHEKRKVVSSIPHKRDLVSAATSPEYSSCNSATPSPDPSEHSTSWPWNPNWPTFYRSRSTTSTSPYTGPDYTWDGANNNKRGLASASNSWSIPSPILTTGSPQHSSSHSHQYPSPPHNTGGPSSSFSHHWPFPTHSHHNASATHSHHWPSPTRSSHLPAPTLSFDATDKDVNKREAGWGPLPKPHHASHKVPTGTTLTRVNVHKRGDVTITAAPSSSSCPPGEHWDTHSWPYSNCPKYHWKECTTEPWNTRIGCFYDHLNTTISSNDMGGRNQRWVARQAKRTKDAEARAMTTTDLGGRSQRHVAREARATGKA